LVLTRHQEISYHHRPSHWPTYESRADGRRKDRMHQASTHLIHANNRRRCPSASGRAARVMFVSHSPSLGGAERVLWMLLAGLPRDRFQPSVLVRTPHWRLQHRQPLRDAITNMGIDTHSVDLRWWVRDWPFQASFARGLPRRVERIAELIERGQPDLVVSNTCAAVEAALATRLCGVRHVWHVHEMIDRDPGLKPFLPSEEFHRLVEQLSEHVVVVSNAVREGFLGAGVEASRVTTVYNGLPAVSSLPSSAITAAPNSPCPTPVLAPAASASCPNRTDLFGINPRAPVVCYVGRLSVRKGVVDFIECANRVLRRLPGTHFVLAGPDGGERRRLGKRIRQLGIEQSVHLLGPRKDVHDILRASDVLVVPSHADPLPLVVLEGMRAGLPVVATASGGCVEMVDDGRTGHLVPVGAVAGMSRAVTTLIEQPEHRRRMGQRGKARFHERFSHHRFVSDMTRVCDDVLAAPPPNASLARRQAEQLIRFLQQSAECASKERWLRATWSERLRAAAIHAAQRSGLLRS